MITYSKNYLHTNIVMYVLEDLKMYFSEMEEFEKCIEIMKYIDENID